MDKVLTTYIILSIQIAIAILSLKGRMTYGWGLGDVFYFACYLGVSIIFAFIGTFLFIKKKNLRILNLLFAAVALFNFLQLTILRGTEMPWDGRIFFNF